MHWDGIIMTRVRALSVGTRAHVYGDCGCSIVDCACVVCVICFVCFVHVVVVVVVGTERTR